MKKWMFLCLFSFGTLLQANEGNWENFKSITLSRQSEVPGWCTVEKASRLMDLIHEIHPNVCVEIGVFAGSSVYPMARALKFEGKGVIFGIDPWKNQDCVVGYDPNDPNYGWWNKVDLEKVYTQFLAMLSKQKIRSQCKVMRMTSEQAVRQFQDESIDILHVDGNHTEKVALNDVIMFLPKVKIGGYIWFDDANWPTTQDAVAYLKDHCELLPEGSVGTDCLLFRRV